MILSLYFVAPQSARVVSGSQAVQKEGKELVGLAMQLRLCGPRGRTHLRCVSSRYFAPVNLIFVFVPFLSTLHRSLQLFGNYSPLGSCLTASCIACSRPVEGNEIRHIGCGAGRL